jgi:ribosome recycling factor
VEHLHVEYYGTDMPLNQLANVSVPEARMLVIQPWDKGRDQGDRESDPEQRPRL